MLTDVTAVLSAEFKYRINLYKSLILSAFQLHKKRLLLTFQRGFAAAFEVFDILFNYAFKRASRAAS